MFAVFERVGEDQLGWTRVYLYEVTNDPHLYISVGQFPMGSFDDTANVVCSGLERLLEDNYRIRARFGPIE